MARCIYIVCATGICLSGREERVAGRVGHGGGEVAELDAISRVQHEPVDADVSVDDAAVVQVAHGVEHLHEVAPADRLRQQAAGGLGQQLAQAAVVAELQDDGDAAVDQVMRQQRNDVLVLQRFVNVHL